MITEAPTVTNAQGRLVPDLTEQDFAIEDDGKRQPLTLFANEIQPITVVMLLDRSGSLKPNFDLEQRAAEAFVRAMLPGDKARIGSFAARIQIDPEDFSSDRDELPSQVQALPSAQARSVGRAKFVAALGFPALTAQREQGPVQHE